MSEKPSSELFSVSAPDSLSGGFALISAFRDLADSMPVLVWITRSDGSYEYSNRRWHDYTGLTPQTVTLHSWQACVHPDDVERAAACWTSCLKTGEAYEIEYRFRRADGEYRWHLTRGLPARDGNGQIARWFGTSTDIHDRKLAEQAVADASRTKDEFLSIVSHELRTPLSAILGWTQLLEMEVLDDAERREAIQTIKQQAKAQSQLIEDLLDVSRILNGKLHLRSMDVSLAHILGAAVNSVQPVASQSGVKLTHGDWDAALVVRGDPQRLQQVVTILLTNAIKFTPKGGTVDLSLAAENDTARVIVHDSGMGIPVDQIEEIFEHFKQAGGQAIREKGGLGLGLSIVRHVVTASGGTVCARSDGPGTGSQFEMTLPLTAVIESQQTQTADALSDTETLAGVRVLVVDDEESARTVIAASLKQTGATVLTARNASEAFDLLSTQPIDAIVSDVAMPGESGLELIARVRQSSKPFKALPALALTGFASVDDQTRALAAGFQMHAAKPVEPLDLARRVATICRQSMR